LAPTFNFETLTGKVVRGDSGPVAVNSKFGWVVSCPNPYPDNENDDELSCALRRLWDIKSLGIQDDVDRMRESEFLPDHCIRKEFVGCYEIQLPWENNCTGKPDGYMMC